MATIANAANQPLFAKEGTVPDVSGALQDYFQAMVFETTEKTVTGFQVVETDTPINFRGMIQPYTERRLQLLPEGQRAWSWFQLYADPSLTLNVDDVVVYEGVQTRIMSRQDFSLYGYILYIIVQDWTGAGP